MEKKIKYIRLGILILVIFSIIAIDVRMVKYINNKKVEGYSVQNYDIVWQTIQDSEYEIDFKAVSGHIENIRLWGEKGGAVTGQIIYEITDTSKNLISARKSVEAYDIWNKEGGYLELDTSDAEFDPGETYFLQIKFELEEPLEIMMDAEGIMFGQYYRVDYQGILYAGMVIINLLLLGGLAGALKWGLNDRLFLTLSIIVGLLAVFLTPPFARDDEFRHFVRAYDWSYGGERWYYDVPEPNAVGNILADTEGKTPLIKLPLEISELRLVDYSGNYNQRSYFAEINVGLCIPKLFSVFSQPEEIGMVEVSETATAWKGLESYWPQAAMIAFSRLIRLRSGLWYYMAGFGQVLASSVMLWFALRLTKNHKNLIWIYSFIPVVTLLRGSCNPDGLMMAEVTLCLAVILHFREYSLNLWGKKAAGMLLLYLVLVYQVYQMKMPYALLCLGFLLLLRKENFAFINWEWLRRHRLIILCGIGGFLLVALVYLIGIRKGDLFFRVLYQFLPQGHFEYIMSNLGEFMELYLRRGWGLIKETFESLRGNYYISYGIFAVSVLLLSRKRFSLVYKAYQLFLFLCVLGMIVLMGYTLTPPDYGQIWGVTYRYMLPALPVLGLSLPLGNKITEECVDQLYPLILLPIVFSSCLFLMWY